MDEEEEDEELSHREHDLTHDMIGHYRCVGVGACACVQNGHVYCMYLCVNIFTVCVCVCVCACARVSFPPGSRPSPPPCGVSPTPAPCRPTWPGPPPVPSPSPRGSTSTSRPPRAWTWVRAPPRASSTPVGHGSVAPPLHGPLGLSARTPHAWRAGRPALSNTLLARWRSRMWAWTCALHTHASAHVQACTHVHTGATEVVGCGNPNTHIFTQMYKLAFSHTHARARAHTRTHTCTHTCTHAHTYTYTYTYTHTHTYTEPHTQAQMYSNVAKKTMCLFFCKFMHLCAMLVCFILLKVCD